MFEYVQIHGSLENASVRFISNRSRGLKMILVLMSDATLRRRFLGSAKALEGILLPAFPLAKNEDLT